MSNEEKKGERNSLFVDDCFIRRTYFSFLVIYFGLFFLLLLSYLFPPFCFPLSRFLTWGLGGRGN